MALTSIGILPRINETGVDPFAADLPVNGFPAVAIQPLRRRGILSARGILGAPPSSGATGGRLLMNAPDYQRHRRR